MPWFFGLGSSTPPPTNTPPAPSRRPGLPSRGLPQDRLVKMNQLGLPKVDLVKQRRAEAAARAQARAEAEAKSNELKALVAKEFDEGRFEAWAKAAARARRKASLYQKSSAVKDANGVLLYIGDIVKSLNGIQVGEKCLSSSEDKGKYIGNRYSTGVVMEIHPADKLPLQVDCISDAKDRDKWDDNKWAPSGAWYASGDVVFVARPLPYGWIEEEDEHGTYYSPTDEADPDGNIDNTRELPSMSVAELLKGLPESAPPPPSAPAPESAPVATPGRSAAVEALAARKNPGPTVNHRGDNFGGRRKTRRSRRKTRARKSRRYRK